MQGGQLDVPEVCGVGQGDVPWSVQPVQLDVQRVHKEQLAVQRVHKEQLAVQQIKKWTSKLV